MEILIMVFSRLRYSARLQFHKLVRDLINKYPTTVKVKIAALFDPYAAKIETTEEAFKQTVKSVLTEEINDEDVVRDGLLKNIRNIIILNTKNVNANIKAAAKRVLVQWDAYKTAARKPLTEETVEVSNLVNDMETKFKDDIKLIGIETLVEQLEANNDKIDTLMQDRFAEAAKKSRVVLKNELDGLDERYHKMTKRISAYAEIEGEADYADFIVTLNAIIGKYNKKSATYDSKEEEEKPTDEDKYPEAKEWEEDLPFMGVENGDIYYILVDGKKVFYKLVDKQKFFWHPESEKAAGGWEKL